MSSSKFYVNKTEYYVLEYLEEYGAALKKSQQKKWLICYLNFKVIVLFYMVSVKLITSYFRFNDKMIKQKWR